MSESWKFEVLSVHAGYSPDPTTKAFFVESLGNPQGNVTGIARIAEIAHRHGIPLIVDNTVATRYLLRMYRINENALPGNADFELAQRYLGGKASGLLTFGVKSVAGEGRVSGARFLDALGLFTRLVNIGDAKSLATHPASTTHRQLSPAELATAGVGEDTVRLSVGIEHIEDLLADLEQSLAAV